MARPQRKSFKQTVAGLKAFIALCAYYNHCCICCGRLSNNLTQDHVDPFGPNVIENIYSRYVGLVTHARASDVLIIATVLILTPNKHRGFGRG